MPVMNSARVTVAATALRAARRHAAAQQHRATKEETYTLHIVEAVRSEYSVLARTARAGAACEAVAVGGGPGPESKEPSKPCARTRCRGSLVGRCGISSVA